MTHDEKLEILKNANEQLATVRSQRQRWCDDYWREAAELAKLKYETSERIHRMETAICVAQEQLLDDEERAAPGKYYYTADKILAIIQDIQEAYNGGPL